MHIPAYTSKILGMCLISVACYIFSSKILTRKLPLFETIVYYFLGHSFPNDQICIYLISA